MVRDQRRSVSTADDSSRRSFLKTGALASTAGALGLSGAGTSAGGASAGVGSDDENQDPDSDQDQDQGQDQDQNRATNDESMNLADVTYLRLMAYHHRGGIELAELVPDRTDRPELRELSRSAIEMQSAELEELESLLADAGIDPGTALEAGLDDVREFVTAIPGNPKPNEVAYLEVLESEQFDLRFIELFAYHHSGAIQLSRRVLREGQSPAVEAMATEIVETQLGEIVQLYEWYLEWV